MVPFLRFLSNVYDVRSVESWKNSFETKQKIEYIDMDLEKQYFQKGKLVLNESRQAVSTANSQHSATPTELSKAGTPLDKLESGKQSSGSLRNSQYLNNAKHKSSASFDLQSLPFASFQQSSYQFHRKLPSYCQNGGASGNNSVTGGAPESLKSRFSHLEKQNESGKDSPALANGLQKLFHKQPVAPTAEKFSAEQSRNENKENINQFRVKTSDLRKFSQVAREKQGEKQGEK